MDMGLSEIQQMLKNSAREFLAQECPLTLVREMEEDAQGFTEELWRQITSLGWTGVPFPEQYGGTGGSFLDLAVLVEEMGRSLLPAPFFATVVLGGLTVLDAGNDDQKRDILTGVCAGTVRVTLALTEPSATTEAWGVETTADAAGNGYSINGTKLFVPDAHAADTLIVAARTAPAGDDPTQGITLFLVPAAANGVAVERVSTIGDERLCEVRLDNVAVDGDAVLGTVGGGWPIIQRALARATAAHCVQMVGGADAVLEMTVEYVKQRTQFGRPVGSFQAVQHHCANMATDVEGARQIAYQAAWAISEGQPARREVAMAKAWCSGAYQRVCSLGHQCHGAIGFTQEHNLQLYTRRAKVQELSYGNSHDHKEVALQEIEAA
jgi:alkylation response protein AidB-like acyl-CoA dehydrogenase